MSTTDHDNDPHHVDDDAPGPPISVPDSGDTGEGGKIKMIVQLVKKCLGVKDIAAMRLSLPASLLEPIPNLEYWNYLDRPDFFAAINESDDPFIRMLSTVRFTFTKDLKFVHGKVCKPYNSVLGEHFRAHWDITPAVFQIDDDTTTTYASESASIKSGKSSKSTLSSTKRKSISTAATSLDDEQTKPGSVRVIYLTEQVSHHPPVSAYFASCPSRSLNMSGIDQISAKVSGTTLRVSPGQFNQGIFINITGGPGEGERYHITHPIASVNGILRGSFYVTVGESTIITCEGGKPGHKFRTIIEYKEESWLGRAHFLVEGIIHTVFDSDANHCAEWTKVKHVPKDRVVAVFDGTWRGHMRWKRVGTGIREASYSKADFGASDGEWMTLIDLSVLGVMPKTVRPLEKQHPRESRKLWETVTDNLTKKEFSEATKEKVNIEQRQREEAAERKRKGIEFVPRYFEKELDDGYAALTQEGLAAVDEELQEDTSYCIEGVDVAAHLEA
ncbi:hypothetical protein BDN70DRAFT_794567 [Pholiota conissans]|uniref:Oxysterol-binding protein n=1 Tax=Pholiota conissans TaxID=109636 RepID=A0A9P6D0F2_9AGAR|nr:hypothetical protein BDN70DRAFT_794567 [Pholiota conissans]